MDGEHIDADPRGVPADRGVPGRRAVAQRRVPVSVVVLGLEAADDDPGLEHGIPVVAREAFLP